jgi:hypothetical protein
VATNNNSLDINGSNQNRESDLLKKIEDLIESEEFEEARSLLDILIQDDSDPLKRNLIKKMDEIIQDSGEDESSQDDYFKYAAFDGTDPQPYYALDQKLINGTATRNEIQDLYMFWSAYPGHKSDAYCLKMFTWLVQNNCSCSSDLAMYIIDSRKNPSVACFYYVLSRARGFFDDVDHIAEEYEELYEGELLDVAESEYEAYLQSNKLPESVSLEIYLND